MARKRDGYEGLVGPHVIGDRNDDGRRTLDFFLLNNAAIINIFNEHQEPLSGPGMGGTRRSWDIQEDR